MGKFSAFIAQDADQWNSGPPDRDGFQWWFSPTGNQSSGKGAEGWFAFNANTKWKKRCSSKEECLSAIEAERRKTKTRG